MITVNSIEEVTNKWVNDDVKVLCEPSLDEETGKWRALANAYGMLAIVELSVNKNTEIP